MDAFHGAGQWKCSSGFPPAAFGGRKTKNRAQPFAAREKRITHRFVDRRRRRGFLGQKPIQRVIDQALAGFQVPSQIHDAKEETGLTGLFRITKQKASFLKGIDANGYRAGFVDLVRKAQALTRG